MSDFWFNNSCPIWLVSNLVRLPTCLGSGWGREAGQIWNSTIPCSPQYKAKPDESKAFAVIESKFLQISLTLLNFVFVKAITSICLVVRIWFSYSWCLGTCLKYNACKLAECPSSLFGRLSWCPVLWPCVYFQNWKFHLCLHLAPRGQLSCNLSFHAWTFLLFVVFCELWKSYKMGLVVFP